MALVPKMPAFPPVLVVAIVAASIFASPCTAGRPLPAVDAAPAKPPPTSPAAQGFVRTRCDQCWNLVQPEKSKICYELLLPYATYINGSYNRAAIAGVTVMVSKFKAFAASSPPPPKQDGCIQVVNGAISGAKEPLTKLGRLDAIGDDKVDAENPDLVDVYNWISDVLDKFIDKCPDASAGHVSAVLAAADSSLSIAIALIRAHRPYWKGLPSPDGSGPDGPVPSPNSPI